MAKTQSKFIKVLPNILSLTRFVLSTAGLILGIFVLKYDVIRWIYVGFFSACIITDIADGKLARHFDVCSELGSKMDALGDYSLTISVFVFATFELKVFSNGDMNLPVVLGMFVVLASIKAAAAVVARIRFGKFNSMHTYGNKAVGGMLMACGLAFIILNRSVMWILWIVVSFVLIATVEELALVLHDEVYVVDRKGFLFEKSPKKEDVEKANEAL